MNLNTRINLPQVHQGILKKTLELLFPNDEIKEETKKQSNFTYNHSGSYLELDIWIPNHNIAFEFQDTYHYVTMWYAQDNMDKIQMLDLAKKEIVEKEGITFIVIPCWWDSSPTSLSASIHFQRPDLFPSSNHPPIPTNPPSNYFENNCIPDVVGLMLASFPADTKFCNQLQKNIWWLGEKYDGVRFCWNPLQNVAYTRTGKEVALESSFFEHMPNCFLDGEFWFGRGYFATSYLLGKGSGDSVPWNFLRMVVFDDPSNETQNEPFEIRYSPLLSSVSYSHPFIVVASRQLCTGSKHLNRSSKLVISGSGEGVILRKVNSLYDRERSANLVKVKASYADKEGLVVGVDSTAVQLKLPNGQIFSVPLNKVHITIPKKGDVVTFAYESHARRELPVNSEITRNRSDLSWQDVLSNYSSDNKKSENFQAHTRGYWNKERMREFLENLAKKTFHLDPSVASTWYSIPFKAIYSSKEGRTILRKFKGHFDTLNSLFPNIGLNSKLLQSKWDDFRNRRNFFIEYATTHQFDPLIPDNWYSQPRLKIKATKGALGIILYHKGSVSRALLDLFPEIGLDKNKILASWYEIKDKRKFLQNFAKEELGMDPLLPDTWYEIEKDKSLLLLKKYKERFYHPGGLSKALMEVFPNIGLEFYKFPDNSLWQEEDNRRKFFETFASENGFDPLVAHNWYHVKRRKILSVPGARKVLSYHNESFVKALRDLFPDVSFSPRVNLSESQIGHDPYEKVEERITFFKNYAKFYSFDFRIPENWYSQPKNKILAFEGATRVLRYHKDSVGQALIDLLPSISFDKSKFSIRSIYHEEGARREFFKQFAQENNFDYLSENEWYLQPKETIMQKKGVFQLIGYHKWSVATALMELFPEINFIKSHLFSGKLQHKKKCVQKYV